MTNPNNNNNNNSNNDNSNNTITLTITIDAENLSETFTGYADLVKDMMNNEITEEGKAGMYRISCLMQQIMPDKKQVEAGFVS